MTKTHPNAVSDFIHAYQTGDVPKMASAFEQAIENDARRLEEEHKRREAQVVQFQAEPKPVSRYKIISIAGRVGRRPATLYITKVNYKDGGGYKVSKIAYSDDKSKALEFSTVAATEVSEYLIRCGYTPRLDTK